jgi:hypothetical protein
MLARQWLHLVRSEYLEMPGLHLTEAQMRRLWGFDQQTCEQVIEALVAINFLRKTAQDGYVLADSHGRR